MILNEFGVSSVGRSVMFSLRIFLHVCIGLLRGSALVVGVGFLWHVLCWFHVCFLGFPVAWLTVDCWFTVGANIGLFDEPSSFLT